MFDFPCLAKSFQRLEDFFNGVARRIPVQPIEIDTFHAETLETRIEICLNLRFRQARSVHRLEFRMRPLGGEDNLVACATLA